MRCLSQPSVSRATVAELLAANKLAREIKSKPGPRMRFHSVDPQKLKFVACSGAGWGNRPDDHSQSGYLLLLTEPCVVEGQLGEINVVEWEGRRIRRVVRSSLAAEVQGLGMALESSSWARVLWSQICTGVMNVRTYKSMLKSNPLVACIVCKSIYGHFHKIGGCQATADKRANIELKSTKRQHLEEGVRLRWVDGRTTLADCLTKPAGPRACLLYNLEEV